MTITEYEVENGTETPSGKIVVTDVVYINKYLFDQTDTSGLSLIATNPC